MEGKRYLYLILLFACAAVADDATLTWTNPTGTETCQNSTAPLALAGTKIYRLVAYLESPTATEYVDQNLLPGTYEYVAAAVDTEGNTSRLSGAATKTSAAFKANAGLFAYGISQTADKLVLFPVGTVAADVDCDTTQSVNGFYRIPAAAVTYAGSQRPATVFAECG